MGLKCFIIHLSPIAFNKSVTFIESNYTRFTLDYRRVMRRISPFILVICTDVCVPFYGIQDTGCFAMYSRTVDEGGGIGEQKIRLFCFMTFLDPVQKLLILNISFSKQIFLEKSFSSDFGDWIENSH